MRKAKSEGMGWVQASSCLGQQLLGSETPEPGPGEWQGPAPASGCVWAGCHSLPLPCCLSMMGREGVCFQEH